MNIEKTINSYLEELSSNSPTPGGGNVAAFSGMLAVSLGIMVCNLTLGKKKYQQVEPDITAIKEILDNYKTNFSELSKLDNEAFDKVMDAFKLPKDTDEQKSMRTSAIEIATLEAAEVPLSVMKQCKEVLPIFEELMNKGNQNSLSDVGVAISLASSACEGAYLNVVINCSSISGNQTAYEYLTTGDRKSVV